MKVTAAFDYNNVDLKKDQTLHLVLTLTAPKLDWEKARAPLALMLTVDTSGSMNGDKLRYAQESLLKMVDHLSPQDYCGLTEFNSESYLRFKPQLMTPENKQELKAMVLKLRANGGTAFADGMLTSLAALRAIDGEMVKRVIMFTDGEANVGPSRPDQICALLPEHLGTSSISSFGYGKGANQDLMEQLSTEAKGNYAFIETPDAAPKAFAKELGGLLSVYAHRINLTMQPTFGLEVLETVTDVTMKPADDNSFSISIPELLSEEVRHLVVKCRVKSGDATETPTLKLSSAFTTMSPVQTLQTCEFLQVARVEGSEVQTSPTPAIDKLVAVAQLNRKQIEAEAMVKKGNYFEAQACLSSFSGDLQRRGLSDLSGSTSKMAHMFNDASSYNESLGYLKSGKALRSRAVAVASADSSALMDFERGVDVCKGTVSNSLQDQLIAAFSQPAGAKSAVALPNP